MTKIIFLTGASGSGKTATTNRIEQSELQDITIIHSDTYGIPEPQEMVSRYGGGDGFQSHLLQHWLDYTLTNLGSAKCVIIEGSFKLSIIEAVCKSMKIVTYKVILFDCSDIVRKNRLIGRGQPEIATQDMMQYAQTLRDQAKEMNTIHSIDTSDLSLESTYQILSEAGKVLPN